MADPASLSPASLSPASLTVADFFCGNKEKTKGLNLFSLVLFNYKPIIKK